MFLGEAENLSEEQWDITMDVNLKAPILLSQLVAWTMMNQKHGRIINSVSQAGVNSLDRHVAYIAGLAAVIGMTKVLACERTEYGIRVNAISPSVILTERGEKARAGKVGEAMKKNTGAAFGLPRGGRRRRGVPRSGSFGPYHGCQPDDRWRVHSPIGHILAGEEGS